MLAAVLTIVSAGYSSEEDSYVSGRVIHVRMTFLPTVISRP